jgi:magnesium chelatase family protein
MDTTMLRRHVKLGERTERMLTQAYERGALSARGQHRILRVARTIADLEGRDKVEVEHLSRALALRPEPSLSDRTAA